MTKLPTPVISKPNIILRPSKYVVKLISNEGIHSYVWTNVLPLATEGISLASMTNKVIGTNKTTQPILINFSRLYIYGTKAAIINGIIMAILIENKI